MNAKALPRTHAHARAGTHHPHGLADRSGPRRRSDVAARAVRAALDPAASPVPAGNLALRVIETVDPPVQAEISYSGPIPQSAEDFDRMRPEELDAFLRSQLPQLP